MKIKNKLFLALPIMLAITSMTGCAKNDTTNGKSLAVNGWDPILEYKGDIDVMMYIIGHTDTYLDIGNPKWTSEDIIDQSAALFFAAAREFKKIYPDIKINMYSCDGADGHPSYYESYRNYLSNHDNRPPHIMHHVNSIPTMLESGIIADFSQYKDEFPLYKYLNKDLLKYSNYGGFQASVPFGVYPKTITLNTYLYEGEGSYGEMPAPEPGEWTLDALDALITSRKPQVGGVAGLINLDIDMPNFVLPTIYKNYIEGKNVDLNTPEVRHMLELEYKWNKDYVWYNPDSSEKITGQEWHNWQKVELMSKDRAVVQLDRSFSMGGLSQKAVKNGTADHLDMYPYPGLTEEDDLSLGIMFGALHLGNQCPIINNKETCTKQQRLAQEAAAYFATFMVSDPRSIKAASEIEWNNPTSDDESDYEKGKVVGAIKGFPVLSRTDENGNPYALPVSVEGVEDEYNQQLSYFLKNYPTWNPETKPGVAKVMEMYSNNDFIVCSDNFYPWVIPDNDTGGTKNIFGVWNGRWYTKALGEVNINSVTWASTVAGLLNNWANDINSNTEMAWNYIEECMHQYYKLPADFDVRDNTKI